MVKFVRQYSHSELQLLKKKMEGKKKMKTEKFEKKLKNLSQLEVLTASIDSLNRLLIKLKKALSQKKNYRKNLNYGLSKIKKNKTKKL